MSERRIRIMSVGALIATLTACSTVVPSRRYLWSEEQPTSTQAPTGYVVLTSRPTQSDELRSRLEVFCDAYRRNLQAVDDFASADRRALVVTYWLLAGRRSQGMPDDCDHLVEKYDYPRAARIAATVSMSGAHGPVLVATPGLGSSSESLVLDLSDFPSNEFDRALAIWKDRVSRDPAVWKDGFKLIVIREAFRNFVQAYGIQILTVVKGK